SKDVYTGKGWETSAPPDYNQLDDFNWELTRTFLPSVETEAREAHVEFMGETSINKLVHPYGIYSASTLSEADFFYDVVSNS
ncbi:hypothetical protein R0K17_28695, partial [Planococcus sp. SIMBA_143]